MDYGPWEGIIWSRDDPAFYDSIKYITVFTVTLPLVAVLLAKFNLYRYIEFDYYQF
jgi:hypothetical protein